MDSGQPADEVIMVMMTIMVIVMIIVIIMIRMASKSKQIRRRFMGGIALSIMLLFHLSWQSCVFTFTASYNAQKRKEVGLSHQPSELIRDIIRLSHPSLG